MANSAFTVAVAGATGAVGGEMIKVLRQRNFPVKALKPIASERSRGKTVSFGGNEIPVEVMGPEAFKGVDIALFSAGGGTSREWAPVAVRAGAVVIDNSSAWRRDPEVPLVVPEVNGDAILRHRGIIANPNCSTIQLVVVLKPIHDAARIKRVIVSTYQAVSGKSGRAMAELADSSRAILEGREAKPVLFPKPMGFNVSFDWPFENNGFTEEEMKMTRETVKIMEDDSIKLTATTARVPVFRGHAESVWLETAAKISADKVRELLRKAPGVEVLDDPAAGAWPTPREAEGKDASYVGRIRDDFSAPNALWMWVVSDNLLKGAALNAVQIAEILVERDLLRPAQLLFT